MPLKRASGTGSTGGGVNITINVSGADPDVLKKVVERQIAPYLWTSRTTTAVVSAKLSRRVWE